MTPSTSVLIVEDEDSFIDALTLGLTREGFKVSVARDGAEALDLFDDVAPDLVLLDVMLPKISGLDVCRELRARSNVPIIMVTAKGAEIDTVVGPRGGRRRLRDQALPAARAGGPHPGRAAPPVPRRAGAGAASGVDDVVEVGDVRVDHERHEVFIRGDEVRLPLKEFELLDPAARERRAGADPRDADRPGVGRRLRRRHQDPRRPHQAPAVQGRAATRPAPPGSSPSGVWATSTRAPTADPWR